MTEYVMRFEWMGLSVGLYKITEDDTPERWGVVSTSTSKVWFGISFEHAREIFDGCINEIRSRVGYPA